MSDDQPTTSDDAAAAADAETQPQSQSIDPDRPAAADASDSAQPPTEGASVGSDGSGVTIPSWLAGALVVVLALLIAGAGFAIGRATAPEDDGFRPIVATERGRGGGDGPRAFPGPGGLPGAPGGRGPEGRGGGPGPRAVPFPEERGRSYEDDDRRSRDPELDEREDDSESGGSDAPAPPDLPGT